MVQVAGFSKVFDPISLFSHVTVRRRLLMKEIWERRIPWDNAPAVVARFKGRFGAVEKSFISSVLFFSLTRT